MADDARELPCPPEDLYSWCEEALLRANGRGEAVHSTRMRLLFVVAHCFNPTRTQVAYRSSRSDRSTRGAVVARALLAAQQTFGAHQYSVDVSATDVQAHSTNDALRAQADIVVCTTRGLHLLDDLSLPRGTYSHRESDVEPEQLTFVCREVLAEAYGDYDYYCFLEDDVCVSDPLFFDKLSWFNDSVGAPALLQPNNFERQVECGAAKVVYGSLPEGWSKPYQDVHRRPVLTLEALGRDYNFRRTTNPHAQSCFLSGAQLERWLGHPSFLDRSVGFAGPLESGVAQGIMQTFEVYKAAPENAGFLEVEHLDRLFFPDGGARGGAVIADP